VAQAHFRSVFPCSSITRSEIHIMMKLSMKSVSNQQWKVTGIVASWGIIICFRAVYEFVRLPTPVENDVQSESTNAGWDEQCEEVQLFKSWQPVVTQPGKELNTLHDGDLESMLEEETDENVDEKTDHNASVQATQLHESNKATGVQVAAASHHVHAVASTAWGQGLLDLQQSLDRQIKQQHLRQAEKHLAHAHQAWDKAFSAEITGYEHELCEDPSRQNYTVCIRLRNHDREAEENDALEENYKQRRAESATWANGIHDPQRRLEERRQALHQKHHAHSRLSSRHVKGMTDWAADLEAMHSQLTDPSLGSSSKSKPRAVARSVPHATKWSLELESLQQRLEARQGKQQHKGEHDILPGGIDDDGHHLLHRIAALNKQLCEDPDRRGLPSCAQFRADGEAATAVPHKEHKNPPTGKSGSRLRGSGLVAKELQEHDEQVQHLQDSHRHWEDAFSAKVAAQMREMCSDLRHRSHGHCRDFLEHDVHVPDHLAFHWPPKAAKDANPVVVVTREVLVSARWGGRIPTVGCVALVPQGAHIEKWMDSFVDNFRHQQYEGSKSLVLVYHHTDHRAAKFAKQHADGLFIKAAAAQDAEFPSTAAARFGMWHVRDADIVARWDFEAWHHPERLNMQVRALSLAGRPASLLARWTAVNSTGSKDILEAGGHWDGSLAGENGWMQQNWYPFLRESEVGVVGSHAVEEVVSVDEPGLLAYDSAWQ